MDLITVKEASMLFDPPCTPQNIYYLINKGRLIPVRKNPHLLNKDEVIEISKINLTLGNYRSSQK